MLTLVIFTAKIICCRRIGLMISLVTIAANFEFIALVYLTIILYLTDDISKQISSEEQAGIKFTPCVGLIFIFLINICTTCKYFNALRKPHDDDESHEVYIKWRKAKCVISYTLFSVLFTFHNMTWLNSTGKLPLQLK